MEGLRITTVAVAIAAIIRVRLGAIANGFTIIVADAVTIAAAIHIAVLAIVVFFLAILIFIADWFAVVFANAIAVAIKIAIAVLTAVIAILTMLVFIASGFAICIVQAAVRVGAIDVGAVRVWAIWAVGIGLILPKLVLVTYGFTIIVEARVVALAGTILAAIVWGCSLAILLALSSGFPILILGLPPAEHGRIRQASLHPLLELVEQLVDITEGGITKLGHILLLILQHGLQLG